jgi:hypothetical protein
MMRVGRWIPIAILVLAGGCIDASQDYRVYVTLASGASMPTTYRAGDTVQFVAEITHKPFFDFDGPEEVRSRSDERPDLFTWSTTAPEIAEVIAPGVVVMRQPGEATLRVVTASATAEPTLFVASP